METGGRLRSTRGFTLVEVAIVLVVVGLLIMGTVRAQQLIGNARVRDLMAQQDAVEQAILAFEDRFGTLPGDYAEASKTVDCGPVPCLNGNGNGRVEAGSDGAIHEDILAWQHLAAAGYVRGHFQMLDPGVSIPSGENTPSSVFGGYLHIAFDDDWGYSGNRSPRHNLKTSNHVPAAVLAEVDRKTDDGLPGAGRFQFSQYAGAGTAPPPGGSEPGCMSADGPAATWLEREEFDNCGAATLLR